MAGTKSLEEVFNVGIDGWCYGIANYPGDIYPGLLHTIIREMAPDLRNAVSGGIVVDVLDISKRFSKAAKYLVHEKEIAFSFLAQLPNPATLNEDGQYTMAQVLDKVEQAYGGVLTRLERRWGMEKRQAA